MIQGGGVESHDWWSWGIIRSTFDLAIDLPLDDLLGRT